MIIVFVLQVGALPLEVLEGLRRRGVKLVDPLSEFSLPRDQSIALVKKIRMHLPRDVINVRSFGCPDEGFFHSAGFVCLGLGVRCSHFRAVMGCVRNAWTEDTSVRSTRSEEHTSELQPLRHL